LRHTFNPQSGHGVDTTPIDFYLTKKPQNRSLHLNGIRFCNFSSPGIDSEEGMYKNVYISAILATFGAK